jgi:hypothetical protein
VQAGRKNEWLNRDTAHADLEIADHEPALRPETLSTIAADGKLTRGCRSKMNDPGVGYSEAEDLCWRGGSCGKPGLETAG